MSKIYQLDADQFLVLEQVVGAKKLQGFAGFRSVPDREYFYVKYYTESGEVYGPKWWDKEKRDQEYHEVMVGIQTDV